MFYENSAQRGAFLLRIMKIVLCINIFAIQNVRRRTLFSELRGLFLRTPCKTWKTAPENPRIL